MLGLVEWVRYAEERTVEWPPAVIAGVIHYNVAEVHPFADGNGRAARLLATAVLMRHELAPGRLFNFDAHYGTDKEAYLAALRSVRERTLNLESWMRYLLDGLATEYERVAGEVDRLAMAERSGHGSPLQLSEAQQRGITELLLRGVSEFTRRDYEKVADVGRSVATRELAALADAGIVDRVGEGSARRYRVVAARSRSGWKGAGGRPRAWTDERIERELGALVDGSGTFPTVAQFDAVGARRLYNAIQRHGGSASWAERLGIAAPERGRSDFSGRGLDGSSKPR
jgi:DNA-binding transcriptional ArsR family regulator